MGLAAALKDRAPPAVFNLAKTTYNLVARPSKENAELNFWRMQFEREGGRFSNSHYEEIMKGIGRGLPPGAFANAIVCDFGCGPRGSLAWLKGQASQVIGVDVLVPLYLAEFGSEMKNHGMQYVACTETKIPLPDAHVDIIITINSLDHVSGLPIMCNELVRITRPGGFLLGAFNLDEPATPTEPLTLTEGLLDAQLLKHFEKIETRIFPKRKGNDSLAEFFGRVPDGPETGARTMWFAGRKGGQ